MTPSFSVSVGGTDVTRRFNDRLVSLIVTDAEGKQSDSVEIQLDDRNGEIEIPEKGALMSVSMGYKETGLQFMGLFVVDEVEATGFPMMLTIRGKAADMREDLKKPRTGYWDNKSLQDIMNDIANRNGLDGALVSQSLASFVYKYLPQTEESDLHFITRMARKHDVVAKPANGRLIFSKKGEAQSASGQPMGAVVITKTMLVDFSCQIRDRPAVKKVISTYWDQQKAERVPVEKTSNLDFGDYGPDFEMLHSHGSEEEAAADAQSTVDSQARDQGSLSISIVGNPNIAAEMTLALVGVRKGVDGAWRVKTCTHQLDGRGYITIVDAEYPGAAGKAAGDDAISKTGGGTSTGGVPGGTGDDGVPPTNLDFGGYGVPET